MACKTGSHDILKIFRSNSHKSESTNDDRFDDIDDLDRIDELDVDDFVAEVLDGIDEESAKQRVNVFGDTLHFEDQCDSLSRCPSVTRMAQSLDLWTSCNSDCSVQLSRNALFLEVC